MNPQLPKLLQAGTAVIADVFDSLGRVPPVFDNSLFPVAGQGTRFAGPAYTVSGVSRLYPETDDVEKLGAIDAMPPGVVAVWAGNDIRGVCCFGDLLGTAMQVRGCAGVVVDGGIRDLAFLRTLTMPILARYHSPAQAIGRWKVTAAQEPVHVRGAVEDWVTVNPGDFVFADDDGVIVVAAGMLETITAKVVEWSQTESGARDEIRHGLPLLQALRKYGHL